MSAPPYHVLILCTGNSARSIMAEAVLGRLGAGTFVALSAGSTPTGTVHPLALETLRERGFATDGFRSKSWDEFAGPAAPQIDFVVTVCGNAAREPCPVWPGGPATFHWGFPDPAAAEGSEAARLAAFADVYAGLTEKFEALTAPPLATLGRAEIAARFRNLETTVE